MVWRAPLVVLVACSGPPPSQAAPEPPPPPPSPAARGATSVQLQWSNVVTTDGCFFFSGPDGRDDLLQGRAALERDGSKISLSVGSARFEGVYRGHKLDLVRVSPHEFDGNWLALETIDGSY